MKEFFKGVVKLTEEQYVELKSNGSLTVGDTTITFDENTLYVTDYTIDSALDINSQNPVTNSAITRKFNELNEGLGNIPTNVVTTDTEQEITASKNFINGVKKNGIDLATTNDIPAVADTLSSESSTSALSAKQGKVLNDKITSLMENSNGRVSSFTVQGLSNLLALFGQTKEENDTGKESYVVGKSQITYNGEMVDLISGDVFFVVDTEVPDYWYSLEDKTLYQLETRKIDLSLYALKTELPTTLPASDVYPWAKAEEKPTYDFSEIQNIPEWVNSSTKPTYTASEVGALSALPSNVVLTDSSQTISGAKVFEKALEVGKTTLSSKTGFSNLRLITNDNNNVHQTELYIDDNGNTKITHKNRTLNSSGDDAYIYFNHEELKYVTGGSEGTAATTEYDIITSRGGELVGPLVVKGGSKTSGVIMIKEQGQIISDEGDYCLLGRLDKTLTAGSTAYPLRLRGSEETFKYNNLEGALRSDNAYQFANDKYVESANLFDEIVTAGYVDNNTGLFTENSSGTNLFSFKYFPMKPNTTYSYKTSQSGLWIYEYDANKNYLGVVDIVSGSSFTSKSNTAYFRVAFWGGYGTTYLNDAIVKEGTNPIYYPYNSSSHITNAQAKFLEEEHTQTINLISLVDVPEITHGGLTYKVENGVISINGTATYNFVLKFSLSSSLTLNGTYSSSIFETGTKNNTWGIVLEFDDLTRSNDFGFVANDFPGGTSDHLYMGFDTGFSYNNYSIKPMLIEGSSSPSNFYVGEGEIVHKGYLDSNYLKYIPVKEGAGNVYTVSSSTMFNATWVNDIANGWLYVNFYSGSDNEIYGELVLNGQNVMTVSRVRYSDLGFLIPIRRGDMVRLHLNGSGYEGRDCKLYY